jgi:hypothetical protein
MRVRSWVAAAAVVIGLAAPVVAVTSASAATTSRATNATATAEVSIVDGIPGVPIDIYVNGTKLLADFRFKAVLSEYPISVGLNHIAIRHAGAKPRSKPILSATRVLTAGENATFVAYLGVAGALRLKAFVNPPGRIAAGNARIVVRHVAEAPAVDVFVGTATSVGERVIKDLTNPHQAVLVIPHTTLYVRVFAAGTSTNPVIGPTKFTFKAGTTTIIYAVGSLAGKTLTAVSQSY